MNRFLLRRVKTSDADDSSIPPKNVYEEEEEDEDEEDEDEEEELEVSDDTATMDENKENVLPALNTRNRTAMSGGSQIRDRDELFGDLISSSIQKIPECDEKENLKIEVQNLILARRQKIHQQLSAES